MIVTKYDFYIFASSLTISNNNVKNLITKWIQVEDLEMKQTVINLEACMNFCIKTNSNNF